CRALAVELARYGITANAILPGWTRSDMTARALADEKFVGAVMPRIPVRRFGEPSDFGGIAVYLMSKASSYHTADTFVIDGGYTAFCLPSSPGGGGGGGEQWGGGGGGPQRKGRLSKGSRLALPCQT